LSAYLLATLRKNFQTDLHEIYREGWQWANEQKGKFWRRFGSVIRIRIRIRISTLVGRALAEVCTVPVLLVYKCSTAVLLFFSEMEANVSELVVKALTSSPVTIRDTEFVNTVAYGCLLFACSTEEIQHKSLKFAGPSHLEDANA